MRTIQIFLRRMAELELLDRVYVLAAGSFASLLPVLLLITRGADRVRAPNRSWPTRSSPG